MMAARRIESLLEQLDVPPDKLMVSMVTNGTLLQPRRVEPLLERGVSRFMVTLDGPQRVHDSLRVNRSGLKSFDRIIQNILDLEAGFPSASLVITMNLSNVTADSVGELIGELRAEGVAAPLGFSEVFQAKGSTFGHTFGFENPAWLDAHLTALDHGYTFQPFYRAIKNACSVNTLNEFIVGVDGYIYRYLSTASDPRYQAGHVSHYTMPEFIVADSQFMELNIERPQCRRCEYLPVCGGGCEYLHALHGFSCPPAVPNQRLMSNCAGFSRVDIQWCGWIATTTPMRWLLQPLRGTREVVCAAVKAEALRYWRELRTYYPDTVSDVIVTFLLLSVLVLSGARQADPSAAATLALWYLASSVIQEASVSIVTEKNFGTFERLLLTPRSMAEIVAAKTLVWTAVNAVKITAVVMVVAWVGGLTATWSWANVAAFAVTLLGLFGFTVLFVALTVTFTKTSSLMSIISYVLLFLTGSIIPVAELPTVLRWGSYGLPLTWGIRWVQEASTAGGLTTTTIVMACTTSCLALLVGCVAFSLVMKRAFHSGIRLRY